MPEGSKQDSASAAGDDASFPPSVRGPEVWQLFQRGLTPERYLSRAQRRLGDVFAIQLLGERVVVLGHPDAAREIFSQGSDSLNTGEAGEPLRPIFGSRSLPLLDGDEHLSRRKMMLPPFHGERLRGHETVIRQVTAAELSSWPVGVPIAVFPRMRAYTYSIVTRCLLEPDEEQSQGLGGAVQDLVDWLADLRRVLAYFVRGADRVMQMDGFIERRRIIDHLITDEIAARRELSDSELSERTDILSLLVAARDEAGRPLSDPELIDEVITILIAGSETSASLMTWAIHELARNQPAQDRLAADSDGFADAVINETLRLRPPLPGVTRRLRRSFSIAGYELPAGTTVMLSQQLVQRRPELYPEPWTFKPDRFVGRRPVTAEWFPFGGSVRRCIGASFAHTQTRILLQALIGAYRLTPEKTRPERPSQHFLVMVPARGGRVIAAPR